jgi:spore maturation protein B
MAFLRSVTVYILPAIFIIILLSGLLKDVKAFDVFVEGAKKGISTTFRIIPPLVGLFVAITVFRKSGALELLVSALKPVASFFGIPSEALPLALLRPISGSASLALVADIMKSSGPDSFVGRVVSTMMGSTETIFYTLAVYFGSVGIKNIKYTLAAALIADFAGVLASVWICGIIFGR